ncbi:MAG TPA: hypothetical protein VHZ29_07175 [Rhizomicrobium sp.]|jgi:hypothetical protein|nr:hypothetical protein [Rhizomicrobium sp.]
MKTLGAALVLAAMLLVPAASAQEPGTIAASLPGRIALGSRITVTGLIFRKVPLVSQVHHCFAVVDGLTAARPVGTQYEISFTLRGMDVLPNQTAKAGVIGFHDSIGTAPAKAAKLSFEIPAIYCAHDADIAIEPLAPPNPGANASIGSISLVAR